MASTREYPVTFKISRDGKQYAEGVKWNDGTVSVKPVPKGHVPLDPQTFRTEGGFISWCWPDDLVEISRDEVEVLTSHPTCDHGNEHWSHSRYVVVSGSTYIIFEWCGLESEVFVDDTNVVMGKVPKKLTSFFYDLLQKIKPDNIIFSKGIPDEHKAHAVEFVGKPFGDVPEVEV